MNCLLHGMEGDDEGVVHLGNTLGLPGTQLSRADLILANPPFGTAKGGGGPTRDDFTYKTRNKQLAFLQHIYRGLKPGGRAAVVLPDPVLFEAGVGTEIRRDLMHKCNLHSILRLPTGIFYAQGVKTNVLFFTRGTAADPRQEENCTDNVWVYDLRTNMPSFGKRTPFGDQHLKPFEAVYGNEPDGTSPRVEGDWSWSADGAEQTAENSRWRCFSRDYIRDQKGDSLDISWIKDEDSVDAASLPEPDVLAAALQKRLLAEAAGEQEKGLAHARAQEADAGAIQKRGEAEAVAIQEKLMAEARGLAEKVASMKALDGVGREHEEFRLRLAKERDVDLETIRVRKDVAEAQSKVLAEAFSHANFQIVGGDGQFFDRFVKAVTVGASVDGALDHGEALRTVVQGYLSGEKDLPADLKEILSKPGLTNDAQNLAVAALLHRTLTNAPAPQAAAQPRPVVDTSARPASAEKSKE
jgi:hypothetical protein